MKIIRILLLPLSYLYGLLVLLRNKCYDAKIFKSTEFDLPIISVGNLVVGGTGKTPHIEYLVRLLSSEFTIATLSRGYGRKTKNYILADTHSTANDIGDEPCQFKRKFKSLHVAVDGNRVRGVNKLRAQIPSLQAILLDDAFQHRAIKPGLSIVLSDFNNLFIDDYMFPSGNLREFKSGINRADIIIITKCPDILLPIDRKQISTKIRSSSDQQIYFSYIKYGNFIPIHLEDSSVSKEFYLDRNYSVLLLTGIADTSTLLYYLKDKIKHLNHIKFPDHHTYSIKDLELVKEKFNSIVSENKIILTTEKDAMRLKGVEFIDILKELPLFYVPIEIDFHNTDKLEFNKNIQSYVRTNKKYSDIYSK